MIRRTGIHRGIERRIMENQKQDLPSAGRLAALERIPAAAKRMGISVSQAYREIKTGRLVPLVKLGERASAVPAESVDRWIAERIAESTPQQAAKGGGRE